jgi:membrane-bound lytic murein transglycosylase D
MTLRWMLPLVGLLLASCATTSTTTPETGTTKPALGSKTSAPLSSTATVDEHLFEPGENAAGNGAQVYESVYERMLASFALPDCSDQPASREWAQWYADRPEYMERVLNRAKPWIYFIVDELERRDMPGELALLPIVESAYDPFAYSSGRALGTWQFISNTGRHYGLQQNWWYDGRRDIYASTHAALTYLQDLHKRFEGDWLLALASYNSGQGRVARAIRSNEKAGLPADFWNLKLPRETRGYVPKLLGLTCLFLNAEEFGFNIPKTANKPVLAAMELGTQTDLVLVAQEAGVPIDQLFTLNPGYNRWATAPDGPHRVMLPIAAAEQLEQRLDIIGPEALMRWDQVTVEAGDTLSGLAAVHKVPVSVIRSANRLSSDLIKPGQKLRLPRDDQMAVDPRYAAAAAELSKLQSGLLAADRKTHTVRSGESLSVIARRYRVSQSDLQRWNKISNPNRLRAGQSLVVFLSPAPVSNSGRGPSSYTVRSGDSLWSIARKHQVELNDLMRWNDLDDSAVLQPGQSLKIVF